MELHFLSADFKLDKLEEKILKITKQPIPITPNDSFNLESMSTDEVIPDPNMEKALHDCLQELINLVPKNKPQQQAPGLTPDLLKLIQKEFSKSEATLENQTPPKSSPLTPALSDSPLGSTRDFIKLPDFSSPPEGNTKVDLPFLDMSMHKPEIQSGVDQETIARLEEAFCKNSLETVEDFEMLAEQLKMSVSTIKYWFKQKSKLRKPSEAIPFSANQLKLLEKHQKENPYVSQQEAEDLADHLKCSPTIIKNWFVSKRVCKQIRKYRVVKLLCLSFILFC